MPHTLNESIVEDVALEWFGALGHVICHSLHYAPSRSAAAMAALERIA